SVAELPTGLAPAVVRPAFTLGGTGGGIARTDVELMTLVEGGLAASPIGEVLVEESVEGWLEFELEVMCDGAGNCMVVCSIENIEPVGVHTGDSWTVAPQQTLSDPEYQRMRDVAFACVRAVGLASGGANVQFAYHPETRDLRIIEMNPRASRSSALASKATGYPIAKIAALLAVGHTLAELPNDITGQTTAAFEPALDYVAVKAPRFDFSKFGLDKPPLGTQMQSVGESLGLGRTFPEAFLKAWAGVDSPGPLPEFTDCNAYFAAEFEAIARAEEDLMQSQDVAAAKRFGMRDARIAQLLGVTEPEVRSRRDLPGALAVDSCAAEFEALTPYFYLSHEPGDPRPSSSGKPRIVILGSGANRIGQGIEFDYSCVHAVRAFTDLGYEVIMVNSNPSTVSTDYDTSHRLYLEPVTLESVLDVCEIENPVGVVTTLGGQTPLNLVERLVEAGVPLIGDPLFSIETTEDRARFGSLLDSLGLRAPDWATAATTAEVVAAAGRLRYPVMVRPDYVLGGAGMQIVHREDQISPTMGRVLVDQFIANAIELDVEVLSDGVNGWVAGILEHIEPAGVHSGDSACVIPGPSITPDVESEIRQVADLLAGEIRVKGFLNLQLALRNDEIFVIEANPRASRTVPFLSKATGLPLVRWACQLMVGARLAEIDHPERGQPTQAWAKEAIFPTDRFASGGERGPEMRSTGEVMAGGMTPQAAYARVLHMAGVSRAPGAIGPSLQELSGAASWRTT
ncbi:MAG: carbamoyl phosphate synthase large subunit, partial [Acidimicrobiia bacterium]|nr:carbamoyl phosphate synthase large subunit [Acidimicrobiia bacterium]